MSLSCVLPGIGICVLEMILGFCHPEVGFVTSSWVDVLGSSGNVGGGWLGDGLLSSDHVLVAGDNTGVSGLDSPGSNYSVLHSVLNHGGPGRVTVVGLPDH